MKNWSWREPLGCWIVFSRETVPGFVAGPFFMLDKDVLELFPADKFIVRGFVSTDAPAEWHDIYRVGEVDP